ncbi:MAG: hypothetical protein ACLR56_06005 [Oscillospiraceae bacterium]
MIVRTSDTIHSIKNLADDSCPKVRTVIRIIIRIPTQRTTIRAVMITHRRKSSRQRTM